MRCTFPPVACDWVYSTTNSAPKGIVIQSPAVYWADNSLGAIFRTSLGNVEMRSLTPLISPQPSAYGIAVDSANIYWTVSTASGSVMRAGIDGSDVTVVASGQAYPQDIVVDGTYITWFTSGDNTLKRVHK
jgi:hypothetical protein